MKTSAHRAPDGAALVVTLALLLLFTIATLAFFTQVTTESKTSLAFSDSVATRQLAESATEIVMSQIREATTVPNGAWASQPGMIRVYGKDGGPSDNAHAFYKLYSSNSLTVSGPELKGFDPDDEVPLGDKKGWNHLPALWTDLNEPIQTQDAAGKAGQRFPIFDPAALGKVEGFELLTDSNDDSKRPARMPVRWLYVLRDGSITAPDHAGEDGHSVIWESDSAEAARRTPKKENPIVGRIAFWADDETCKVNINTAGGFTMKDIGSYSEDTFAGSYWDTPRFSTLFDRGGTLDETTGSFGGGEGGLALCQPLQGEFQRYPGHPSTTSLGLVLGNIIRSESLYTLLPRLTPGGSRGGTERLLAKSDAGLLPKSERLFATVDELFYTPKSQDGRRLTANQLLASLEPQVVEPIKPTWLDQVRPFLTAHSSAPELNLAGRPRVTIWPVDADRTLRSTTDDLIAFCSTAGPAKAAHPFIFQRQDPYSTTADGLIARNAKLYDYLRELTSQPVPGYGQASFAQKLGTERDQVLTSIFDYIRCANLRDSTRDKVLTTQAEKDKYKFAPRGVVVPLVMQRDGRETMGFGRWPSISEAALVFYHAGYIPAGGGDRYLDPARKKTLGVSANLMRAFLVLEMMNPMQGYAPTRAFTANEAGKGKIIVHELTGLDAFRVTTSGGTVPLGFPASASNRNPLGFGRGAAGAELRRHRRLHAPAPREGCGQSGRGRLVSISNEGSGCGAHSGCGRAVPVHGRQSAVACFARAAVRAEAGPGFPFRHFPGSYR